MSKIKYLILGLLLVLPLAIEAANDLPKTVHLKVSFFSQAPYGAWSDPRQQDACEEASLIMANAWLEQKKLSKDSALKEILALSKWQEKTLGFYQDTSALTTTQIFKDYFQKQAVVKKIEDVQDIKQELANGNLVIVPANGKLLKNKYFSRGGPDRHMVVVIGYDDKTGEFITNDVGTRWGQNYRYKYQLFLTAIRDYPSGKHQKIIKNEKNIIVINKK